MPARGTAQLLPHDLTPADRRRGGENRAPCRPDPPESHSRHLEAASNRPALAKERPPAAFRLGSKSQKTKASLQPPGPRVSNIASAQGFSSFREGKSPPSTLLNSPSTPSSRNSHLGDLHLAKMSRIAQFRTQFDRNIFSLASRSRPIHVDCICGTVASYLGGNRLAHRRSRRQLTELQKRPKGE